jgi:hypothetical protein
MARYDQKFQNRDIKRMLESLHDQTRRLIAEISVLELRVGRMDQDEPFRDATVRDHVTNISLAAQNLEVESTALWKRTR